jgi:hypothetical protein
VTGVVTDEQSSIDGSSAWTYFNFRLGAEVAPEDPAMSPLWDIAVNGTAIQTNSGTSGSEGGGALDPSATELSAISVAPGGGYEVDSALSIDSQDFSGNPVLNPWYEPASTIPLDKAFLLRTADGGYVKLKIGGHTAGVFTIDWAYAGAGRSEF